MNSSNSSCDHNPITTYTNPFPENDISSTSKLEQYPAYSPYMFAFPNSPHMHLEYDHDDLLYLDLFYQHESITTADTVSAHQEINKATNMADSKDQNVPEEDTQIPNVIIRKRCSKKDRHSKIETARGPRDRRMRLSLDVARKFFGLQDMLGYDKASRTVEWLLRNSSSAIRELAKDANIRSCSLMDGAANSTSSSICDDCEAISSSNQFRKREEKPQPQPSCTKTKKTKKVEVARATVPRESRRKARERARERTSQKRRLISETTEPKVFADQSSLFTHGCKEVVVPIYNFATAEVEDLSSDEARVLVANNPSIAFHYQDNANFSHQHQRIEEFQFCVEPWEAYNRSNLSG